MPNPSRLRHAVEQTRREAKRLARDARQRADPGASSVRFTGRRNIVVVTNTDQPGATGRAAAVQSTSIHQDGRAD